MLKQVEGFAKEDYVKECKNDGGVPILYANMQEAVIALCEYTRSRRYDEFELSEENAEAGIRNSSSCDWILMDDGLFSGAVIQKSRKNVQRAEI